MERCILYIIIPYICQKGEDVKLQPCYPAPASTTLKARPPQKYHLCHMRITSYIHIIVTANCMDKLQPIDVSINT